MSVVVASLISARSRPAGVVLVALALIVAMPFVGRWEQRRNAATQNARMEAVYRLATADGLVSKRLDAYRLAFTFDCLIYYPPGLPTWRTALELCFDPQGRLVETIDRRTDPPHIATLHEQPSLAAVRLPVPRLLRVFQILAGPRYAKRLGLTSASGKLPVRFSDLGALGRAKPRPKRSGR